MADLDYEDHSDLDDIYDIDNYDDIYIFYLLNISLRSLNSDRAADPDPIPIDILKILLIY